IEYLEDLVSQILSIFPKECEELVFIHNAGEMQPVTEIKNLTASDILHNFLLNTISPIALTSAFVRKFFPTSFPLQMIFISSRSVITPRKLWAVYGAAKASIDHFAKSLALEYKRKKSFHVLVIHPPAMETEMRKQYLKKRSWFFWLWDWISIHILRQKKVYHPDLVAWKILYLIEKKSLPSGTVWKWD
ncbi:MAG: SDR family NAD(P)-dependent oxidoreductase, partial [Brevinematales bacterium]